MRFKKKYNKKNVDLHDIHELIEMGLEEEEIAKDFGVSSKYIRKLKNEINKNDNY